MSGVQEGLEARYQNYASITRNLTFSTLPWYDMQVNPFSILPSVNQMSGTPNHSQWIISCSLKSGRWRFQ